MGKRPLMPLRDIRWLHDMTQKKLAEATGLGQDLISHYETGHHVPGEVNREKIASALGVDVNDINWEAPHEAVFERI